MKKLIKLLIYKPFIKPILTILCKLFYPCINLRVYSDVSELKLFKYGFMQRVVGFNRRVPWPVHFTSTVTNDQNITCDFSNRSACPGFSPNCYIQAVNPIIIEENTRLGPGVTIIGANHNLHDLTKHTKSDPIHIQEGSWIGANATILPGVKLGKQTIVGAGSVVTKSFENGGLVIAGVPAKVIKCI
ncbi:MAG: acyltransferase [Candidatus Marinamargulisbacteria bacterium]